MRNPLKDGSIAQFLENCYNEMNFKNCDFSFSKESVIQTIEFSQQHDGYLDIIFEKDNIRGILALMLAPNIMDHSQTIATEYIWHTDPFLSPVTRVKLMKKLLIRAKNWAENKGIHLTINASEYKPAVKRILESEGFIAMEVNYGYWNRNSRRSINRGNSKFLLCK